MAIKKTLLQIVQNILSDMDSEDVNSISDSVEALQVAQVVENTFYNLIATRDIPEHRSLLKLTALSASATPTHFNYPTNVKEIFNLWYDVSETATRQYRELEWVEPEVFLNRTDGLTEDFTAVSDLSGGTTIKIRNTVMPSFYTSFDDYYVVLDAHKSTEDATLQASKIRAYGATYPIFSQSDSYIPDIDDTMHPLLLAEAKSMCFSIFKGGPDVKIEQAAKRQKNYVQNDMYKTSQPNRRNEYGRR